VRARWGSRSSAGPASAASGEADHPPHRGLTWINAGVFIAAYSACSKGRGMQHGRLRCQYNSSSGQIRGNRWRIKALPPLSARDTTIPLRTNKQGGCRRGAARLRKSARRYSLIRTVVKHVLVAPFYPRVIEAALRRRAYELDYDPHRNVIVGVGPAIFERDSEDDRVGRWASFRVGLRPGAPACWA
jgi:hypothetical protein